MRKIVTLVSLALLGSATVAGCAFYGGYQLGRAHQSEVDQSELPKIASLAFANGVRKGGGHHWLYVTAHSWGLGPSKDFVIIDGVPFKDPYHRDDEVALLPEACTGVRAFEEDPDYASCDVTRSDS